ncbi:metal-dependent phosphohydrolase, HD subdomain protein [Pseudonocardia sulfidoxydans NBRC 16205]|uniref:Metal-dependent phosphohydrolase, HD subdomain protein n=1 Tax=Pseudonocardia sulfidoxydans NBRC 16205 TaxID=1223511 RepID=A0A511D8Q6_9PSEU|nr:HD domain-containing protein [Pseudonocardia sulfidoxydans]GEL21171.1 metal-dependent phosphohydrolase, HD subdomain protein [Pseudonocardia sulfidoxydans NBRC 16205]
MNADGSAAAAAARAALAGPLPRRWAHARGVARRARTLAVGLPPADAATLVAAAWLHDVGYAPTVARTGFHPLDGARYAHDLGFPDRVAHLVAYHSAAAVKADLLGLTDQMAEFCDEQTLVRDLLWYADMSTDPSGRPVSFDARMAEVRRRRADDPVAVAALDLGMPARRAAWERAEAWLRSGAGQRPRASRV